MRGWVYILASRRNGTLYVGITRDLARRLWQHRTGEVSGFTQRYGVKLLVWYEEHALLADAIRREKQIKEWRRAWKIDLIERMNPRWDDLYERLNA